MTLMPRSLLLFLAAFVAAAMLLGPVCPAAYAHDAQFSGLTLRLHPTGVRASVTVPLARLRGFTTGQAVAAAGPEAVGAQVLPRVALETEDAVPVVLRAVRVEPVPLQQAVLLEARGDWQQSPRSLTVRSRLYPEDPATRTLVCVYEQDSGGLKLQAILDEGKPFLTYAVGGERQSLPQVVRQYTLAGIHHIFIGPDHILFVVGLLLLGGTLKRLLKIVTAFTVAHSITLVLCALNVFTPPASVIEPLIALSIVCVGAETLVFREGDRDLRALLAFGFGFIHGFAFAGVLREVGLPREALGVSLLSFNVGVEIAQACIVLAVAPVLALVARRSPTRTAPWVGRIGAVVIIAAGAWWFAERVLLGS
jgi:hydrogenase/urease accessory protein HupE